jgi:hypothetical protein
VAAVVWLCLGLLVPGAQAQAPDPATPPAQARAASSDIEAELADLLARVTQSDPTVDFTRLRRLYASSARYRPFPDAGEGAMVAAASAQDFAKAMPLARAILDRDYLNIEAHFVADAACRAAQDAACSAHHHGVAQGILNSIGASGNGQTPETAYVVISQGEEMAVARVLGFEVREQTLLTDPNGHTIDVLSGRDDAGDERQLFFNVDLALAALRRVEQLRATTPK